SSEPHCSRSKLSFSNWIEELSIAILLAYVRKPSGKFSEYKTVKFGSGDGPMLVNVCNIRKSFFVTSERPSKPIPAIDKVAQIGKPENNWLYSGVRANFTIRSFITR